MTLTPDQRALVRAIGQLPCCPCLTGAYDHLATCPECGYPPDRPVADPICDCATWRDNRSYREQMAEARDYLRGER